MRDTFALRPTDPMDAIGRGAVRREYLLRPANPLFIWFSLVIALLMNLMPWGRNAFAPDVLALGWCSGTCISRAALAWVLPSSSDC